MPGSEDSEAQEGDAGFPDLLSRGFEPPSAADVALLVLAGVDVLALLVLDVYADLLPGAIDTGILWADLVLVGVFAIALAFDLSRASDPRAYARNHWYDIVGLIPIAHWAIRAFRLVGLLRLYVVTKRPIEDSPAQDWTDALARLLLARYRDVQVDEIADPIVLTSIERLRDPLAGIPWTDTIGGSLEARRPQIRASVSEALSEDPRLGPLARTRAGRYLVDEVTDATLDATVQTLRSEEMNEAIADAITDGIDGVRTRIEAT